MTLLGIPILTFVIFFPLAGAIVLLALPASRTRAIKVTANVVAGLEFLAVLAIFKGFNSGSGDLQCRSSGS